MALILYIKVVPASGRQEWSLDKSGDLKCYLKSQPERGLANKELIKLLAQALKLPQSAIAILAGDTARRKKIKIDADINLEQFFDRLGLQKSFQQIELF